MTKLAKALVLILAPCLLVYSAMARSQTAIGADLAKKCRAMAIQAHPTPKPGTKATGAEKAQRDYFSLCVSKGGVMDK